MALAASSTRSARPAASRPHRSPSPGRPALRRTPARRASGAWPSTPGGSACRSATLRRRRALPHAACGARGRDASGRSTGIRRLGSACRRATIRPTSTGRALRAGRPRLAWCPLASIMRFAAACRRRRHVGRAVAPTPDAHRGTCACRRAMARGVGRRLRARSVCSRSRTPTPRVSLRAPRADSSPARWPGTRRTFAMRCAPRRSTKGQQRRSARRRVARSSGPDSPGWRIWSTPPSNSSTGRCSSPGRAATRRGQSPARAVGRSAGSRLEPRRSEGRPGGGLRRPAAT